MLANTPIIGFIPTSNATRARTFYEHTIGLRFVSQDNFAVVFDANGIMVRVTIVGKFTPHPFTIFGWQVQDIAAEVAALSANGVTFSRFDFLDQNEAGIWDAPGGTRVAWFTDPDGNTLSLSQH